MSITVAAAADFPFKRNPTLHAGLDAYVKATCVSRSTQRARLSRVEILKQRYEDIPLKRLTFDVASRLIWEWQLRPLTRRGTPCSLSFARQMVCELRRFFKWLDFNESCEWSMPRGLLSSHVEVRRMVCDRQIPKEPSIYTPEQLAVLNSHATPLERLCLYVSLNCAMNASQLGLLRVSNVLFDHKHKHASYLGFESTRSDTWIRTRRPRTHVLGEWRLWPETTAILRWAVERARRLGSEFIFVNSNGRPMRDDESLHPGVAFSMLWRRLTHRVRKSEPDFPALPIGSLRRVLPTYLRQQHDDELVAICLTHSRGRHADFHSFRPYGRFHEAMIKARDFFACVFRGVKDDPHSTE